MPRISIIGAGSGIFSINLIKDICVNPNFRGSSVCLMDVNQARLDGIYGLCHRYIEEMNAGISLEKTLDRETALRGADFVVHVALDYGHERLREGWKIARKHGYHFGGSLHIVHDEAFWVNFYQVRLMESVYNDMQRICPDAWMLLVANPVQMGVTYLCRKYPGAKIIGMCHGSGGVYEIMDALGYDRKDCHFEVSGVNHFVWLTEFYHNGKDAYPEFDAWLKAGKFNEWNEERAKNSKHSHGGRVISPQIGPKSYDLYQRFGLYPIGDTPTPGGGAWAWWYHTDEEKYQEDPETWYEDYFDTVEENVKRIRDAVSDTKTPIIDIFSSMPSDEPMIPTIEALAFDVEHMLVVNIPNDGEYVPGVPKDYEVECRALVSKRGVQGLRMKPLPREIMAYIYRDRIAPVEMEIRAFETGDIRKLEQLVLMDPWTKSLDQAQALIRDILDMPCNKDMKEYFGQ